MGGRRVPLHVETATELGAVTVIMVQSDFRAVKILMKRKRIVRVQTNVLSNVRMVPPCPMRMSNVDVTLCPERDMFYFHTRLHHMYFLPSNLA